MSRLIRLGAVYMRAAYTSLNLSTRISHDTVLEQTLRLWPKGMVARDNIMAQQGIERSSDTVAKMQEVVKEDLELSAHQRVNAYS